jgi:cytochrome c oxidase subunit IV
MNRLETPSHLESHHPHVMPLKIYFLIFGILLIMTCVTVGVSLLALPHPYALIVALGVAGFKGSLVALYFMHLRYENVFYAFIFITSLLFTLLFFVFSLTDISSRGFLHEEQENGFYQKYEPNQ